LEQVEVVRASADGLVVAVAQGGDGVGAAVAELGSLDGGVTATVVFAQGAVPDRHGLLDFGGVGERGGHRISLLEPLRSHTYLIPRPRFGKLSLDRS
jgi:hypothetical protein